MKAYYVSDGVFMALRVDEIPRNYCPNTTFSHVDETVGARFCRPKIPGSINERIIRYTYSAVQTP